MDFKKRTKEKKNKALLCAFSRMNQTAAKNDKNFNSSDRMQKRKKKGEEVIVLQVLVCNRKENVYIIEHEHKFHIFDF